MLIRRKHWGLQTGYDIVTDYAYGFKLCLGRGDGRSYRHFQSEARRVYRWFIAFHWDWPLFTYADENWVLNEPGYIRNFPVQRNGIPSSAWTGRKRWIKGWSWPHKFEVG